VRGKDWRVSGKEDGRWEGKRKRGWEGRVRGKEGREGGED
jgi:hypothetical protein